MDATQPSEEALRRRLAAPLGGKAGSEHPDPELIVAHASNELSPEYGLALTRHLAVCDDGRCTAVLRDVVAGASAARDVLYGRLEPAPSEAPPADEETALPPAAHERSFECDDAIWEAFEEMAREAGRPVDALLDEAMSAFAHDRRGSSLTLPPAVPREVAFHEAPQPLVEPPRERNTPTIQRSYLPRAPASSRRASPFPPPVAEAEHLSVVLEGVRYEVTKERFVVGRGGRSSDLAIDDPGVSRQHAVIERAGGTYYLVDMGSTNGIEYEGERIARKQIAHGDRFRIGDHELEFLFS